MSNVARRAANLATSQAAIALGEAKRNMSKLKHHDQLRETQSLFGLAGMAYMAGKSIVNNLKTADDLSGLNEDRIKDDRNWFSRALGLGDVEVDGKEVSYDDAVMALEVARSKKLGDTLGDIMGVIDNKTPPNPNRPTGEESIAEAAIYGMGRPSFMTLDPYSQNMNFMTPDLR